MMALKNPAAEDKESTWKLEMSRLLQWTKGAARGSGAIRGNNGLRADRQQERAHPESNLRLAPILVHLLGWSLDLYHSRSLCPEYMARWSQLQLISFVKSYEPWSVSGPRVLSQAGCACKYVDVVPALSLDPASDQLAAGKDIDDLVFRTPIHSPTMP